MTQPHAADSSRARHWDAAYAARGPEGVSWYQEEPRISLELIDALEVAHTASVVDIGAGASVLADRLVARGFADVSVLDVSAEALAEGEHRSGDRSPIHRLHEDLLHWRPQRRFELWHDRAVFHFFVDAVERERYLETLRSALVPGGAVIVATFAADGPERCSGLPVARYTAADLAAVLGLGHELVATHREEHVAPTGAVQPFTWVAGRVGPV